MGQYCQNLLQRILIFEQNGKITIGGLLKLIAMGCCGFTNLNGKFWYPKCEFRVIDAMLIFKFAFLKFANRNKMAFNNCLHLIKFTENQIVKYGYM